jgi:heme exporter protein D
MDSFSSFLRMGGYAAYVWPALGLTALVLAGLWFSTRQSIRTRRARLAELQAQLGRGTVDEKDRS